MKRYLLLLLLLGLRPLDAAETVIEKFSWPERAGAGGLGGAEVVTPPGDVPALKISNPGPEPLTSTVLVIDSPKITGATYALTGEVRYEAVEKAGFLEMWSHFGPTAAFFSRGLADGGPMGKLQGTSNWRPFSLPFDATGAAGAPTKLVFNVQLPGKGTVFLRSVQLVENPSAPGAARSAGGWWSVNTAIWIGGLGGTLLGLLAAALHFLANAGKAEGWVLGAGRVLTGLGAATLVVGLIAGIRHQPAIVWYPLALLGGFAVAIFGFWRRRYQAHYRALELRRMASLDHGL